MPGTFENESFWSVFKYILSAVFSIPNKAK